MAGGAVQTAEVTLPGFRHDLFATNLNLFASSPFFAEYGDRLLQIFSHTHQGKEMVEDDADSAGPDTGR